MGKTFLGIDTTVLNCIHKDKAYRIRLETFVAEKNLCLLIPDSAAVEFCARLNSEESNEVGKWLGSFFKTKGFNAVLGLDWRSLIHKEIRGNFERPKFLPREKFKKLMEILENPKIGQDLSQNLQKGKILFLKKDSLLIEESKKLNLDSNPNDINQIKEMFENYNGTTIQNAMLGIIKKVFKLDPLTVLLSPKRYRTSFASAILFEYYAYGLLVNTDIKSKSSNPVYQKSGKQKNTHEDRRIVSECMYCDYFLTEDKTLFKRCLELFNKKLLLLEPLKPFN
jgi:hypothetical protein